MIEPLPKSKFMTQTLHCLTHSGPFHADDVLAAVLLKCAGVIENYQDIERSRDKSRFQAAELVFDVGGDYIAENHRYDHHQRGRSGEEWIDGTPYSSAGLIWKHFKHLITEDPIIQKSLEGSWIRPIDADDNGWIKDMPANARHVSAIVSDLNPRWDDPNASHDQEYIKACEIIETLFKGSWNKAKGKAKAREHVQKAIENRRFDHVLILEEYCPWKGHIHALEKELAPDAHFKFTLFPSGDSYKIFQVPQEKGSQVGRAQFPEPWGGLRESELRECSKVADAEFVHPGLFCGGAGSLEGALAMVEQCEDLPALETHE